MPHLNILNIPYVTYNMNIKKNHLRFEFPQRPDLRLNKTADEYTI